MMVARIVVVGSFNTDLTTYMKRAPQAGETVMGYRFVTGPGGKGSNQAVAAARLGANVTFIGRVGLDEFANFGLRLWNEEGINTDYVVRDLEHPTGVAPIWVDDTGENRIVVAPGANMLVSPADIDAADSVIAQADVLIVQLEIPVETSHYALRKAQSHGVRTILNPAPAVPLPAELISEADFITPNETELAVLSGQHLDLTANARSILVRAGQTVIVTLGAQGARWVNQSDTGLIPAYSVEVVDTTGAGDAFNGGLAVALAEGKLLNDAIAFAAAAAALSVTRLGTSPSMPTRPEVERLLQTNSP
jgi:ribokinase